MNVAAMHFDGRVLNWYCPGCKRRHGATLKGDYVWEWNGSLESPTLSPSVLVFPRERLNAAGHAFLGAGGEHLTDEHRETTPRCHIFMREGRIEFLPDCEHELAGQTVDMVEWVPGPRDGRP